MSSHEKVKWQSPASLLADKKWDVVIIGAGPADAIAAVHMALQNHQVLLLDKQRFPREKVCGDGLIQVHYGVLTMPELGKVFGNVDTLFKSQLFSVLPESRWMLPEHSS